MKLLFVLRQSPYGGLLARESLDAILASSAYGQELSVLFMDDGIFQLTQEQNPEKTEQKNIQKIIAALEMYDVDRLFVCKQSLIERGLTHEQLSCKATLLDQEQIQTLLSEQNHLLSF